MSPRLNITHCCVLQLEEADELLSEEEVWYVLSEMAQVSIVSVRMCTLHVYALSPSIVLCLCIVCRILAPGAYAFLAVKTPAPLYLHMTWHWLQGLHFLHANGVLHLDVKPDNIYRDADGTLKLGDFGLAVLRHQWVCTFPCRRSLLLALLLK